MAACVHRTYLSPIFLLVALTWGHYKVLLQRPDGAGFICRFSALIPGEIAFFGGSAATSACNVSATKFTFSIAFSEALTYNKNVIRQSWDKEIFEFSLPGMIEQ